MSESLQPTEAELHQETTPMVESQAEKRFTLSKETFARERMEAVKTTVDAFKSDHPDALSFCMFGSMVKGRAREQSDIDGFLYFDPDHTPRSEDKEGSDQPLTEEEIAELTSRYTNSFKESLQKEGNLTDEQTQDIKAFPISGSIISTMLHESAAYDSQYKSYLDKKLAHAYDPTIEAPEPMEYKPPSLRAISGMFHLAVGKGIEPYRAFVVNELSQMGPEGERVWKDIMQLTEWQEQDFQVTDKLYPRTLEEAQKRYLSQNA